VDHAAFHSIFGEAVEDYACVVLRAADGMLGVIEAGYTHPDTSGSYEWRINARHGALVDTGARLIATPDRALDPAAYVPSSQRYSRFVADTLARVTDGRPPAVSLAQFARATEIVDQAYRFSG
jgi:predicted dehydrogenase